MKTFVKCCAALCAVAAILAIGGSAFADPYIITTVNSPGSGSSPIVFDGPPTFQYAPATANPAIVDSGLEVDELRVNLGGGNTLIEFTLRTKNHGPIVPQQVAPAQPAGIFFTDLDKALPDLAGKYFVENSGFIYFTSEGQPLPMINILGLEDIVFFPYYLNPAIQVLALGNDALPMNAFGIDTNALQVGLTLAQVMGLLGLDANIVNDVHIGVIVPEPSTLVLGGLGLAVLVPVALRRRVRK